MNNPQISIIVPVYNAEKYISRCLESLLAQTFSDFEIILVDDGSPDNSGKICDAQTFKDSRIKVIHKNNEGAHKARIAGMQVAHGDLFAFVDVDDLILPDSLSILYASITRNCCDIVKGSYIYQYEGGEKQPVKYREYLYSNAIEYLKAVLNAEISPFLHGGLYRKALFDFELLENFKNYVIGEDFLTLISLGNRVHSCKIISEFVYLYNVNRTSVMQTKVISFSYAEKMGRVMRTSLSPNILEKIDKNIVQNRVSRYLQLFFVPELQFNDRIYELVRHWISNNGKENICHSKKLSLFITHKHIFKFYSITYKLLYKIFKLHFRYRTVLE